MEGKSASKVNATVQKEATEEENKATQLNNNRTNANNTTR